MDTNEKKYLDATLYYFINKTSYSGMLRFNLKGEFNVPFGRYKNFNTQLVSEEHSELLKRTEITNEDYSEIFNRCTVNDFVFLILHMIAFLQTMEILSKMALQKITTVG